MLGACILLSLVVATRAAMEGFIVGGTFAKIARFPHSAFLTVSCVTVDRGATNWICGSSVLNQQVLLTAGHCVYSCTAGTHITVNLGHENRQSGVIRSASGFLLHEKYDTMTSSYDIAMIKLFQPVKLNSKISRVAIMRRPPYSEIAHLAGWGLIDEKTKAQGAYLKHIDQKLWKHAACVKQFGTIPRGTICASSTKQSDLAAQGDSGSGLVVRGYIQIGLVSYKVPALADNVIIYTDVGYYYDWIVFNAKRLYCFKSIK